MMFFQTKTTKCHGVFFSTWEILFSSKFFVSLTLWFTKNNHGPWVKLKPTPKKIQENNSQVLVEPRSLTSSSLDSQKRELEEPVPKAPTLGAEGPWIFEGAGKTTPLHLVKVWDPGSRSHHSKGWQRKLVKVFFLRFGFLNDFLWF